MSADLKSLSPSALSAAMRGGTDSWVALLDERGNATVKNDAFMPASPILPGSIMEGKAAWACS